jgi:adhesin transport system membrane fusion protein
MNDKSNPKIVSVMGNDTRAVQAIDTLLDERGSTRQLRYLMRFIALLVLALLLWSVFAKVDEFAKAHGEIRTVSGEQVIQSEEGGTLIELLVQTDEQVKAGQPIARMLSTNIDKEAEQAAIRKAGLEMDVEIWKSLNEKREPDFSAYANYPRLSQEARTRHLNEANLVDSRLAAKGKATESQQAALDGAIAQLPALKREVAAARDVETRYQKGAERGLISAISLSESRERLASAEQRLDQQNSRISELRATLKQAESELTQVQGEITQDASKNIDELTLQIRQIDAEIKALKTRTGQRLLVAPKDGIIKRLPDTRVGAYIPPGGTVAELVPLNEGLLMEALVSPRDIGFVMPGQPVTVKIDSFDYSRFGSVAGKVAKVSPSSFKNETNGQVFYKVLVSLDQDHVGQSDKHRLMPGMTGEADIVTGRKTVFQYLTKPIFLSMDTAFHER